MANGRQRKSPIFLGISPTNHATTHPKVIVLVSVTSKALQPQLRSSCEPTATAAFSYGPSFLCETTVGKITRFCPTLRSGLAPELTTEVISGRRLRPLPWRNYVPAVALVRNTPGRNGRWRTSREVSIKEFANLRAGWR
jgi:hypothetical protein